MTDLQKEQIRQMRTDGIGYLKIVKLLSLSVNTIKTYCRRNDLNGTSIKPDAKPTVDYSGITHCKKCGKPISQTPGKKRRKFCSKECLVTWWNSHPDQIKRRANYPIVCANCQKQFISYGNISRKFCYHACYIKNRFGKD
jgi:endogenous inhibitor of DNA gyrase (YacG/DUF329 family)